MFGEDEVIEGHPDPAVSVHFSPQFHSLLEWSSGGKPDAGATDIPSAMAEALGDGMATDRKAFQHLVAEEGPLEAAVLGTPVDWRGVLDATGTGLAPPAARSLRIYASRLCSAPEQLRVSLEEGGEGVGVLVLRPLEGGRSVLSAAGRHAASCVRGTGSDPTPNHPPVPGTACTPSPHTPGSPPPRRRACMPGSSRCCSSTWTQPP